MAVKCMYMYTIDHTISLCWIPQAAKLSTTSGGPLHTHLHSQQLDPVVVQHNNARAVFQLLESLEAQAAPVDHLHVMVSKGSIVNM